MDDGLSTEHFRIVRAEIEGRFFSEQEAAQLKEALERYTVTDPQIRAMAAKVWVQP